MTRRHRTRFHPAMVIIPLILAAVTLILIPTRTGSPGPEHRGAKANLPWPAPALHDPTVVQLTSARTNLRLDPHRDYVLKLPAGKPLQAPRGIVIAGGHNVDLIGGSVNVPDRSGGALLEGQTGIIHVEGVRFTGPQLMEGIDLSEPDGATVELENVYISTVHGSYSTNHADLIQTWAGPKRLLIDNFYGSSTYQGFFLLPNQHDPGPPPAVFDFRNVFIDDSHGGYVLWRSTNPPFPLHVSNMIVRPNYAKNSTDWWYWPKPSTGDRSWSSVKVGGPQQYLVARVATAGVSYSRGRR